jgi:predicted N-formylglutamate amidohydrolase
MTVTARDVLILSCEHASNHVPARYAAALRDAGDALATHRGYDIGAAWLARWLARRLGAPLFLGRATRLLVDLNRSLHHRHVFSPYTGALPAAEKARIIERHYRPYRDAVTAAVAARIAAGQRVLHVAVHSFTPRLGDVVRTADVGLLYDPGRASERALCHAWQAALGALAPGLAVRRNYPYRGVADGFTSSLRRHLAGTVYAGIELEVSQQHLGRPSTRREALAEAILAALEQARAQVAGAHRATSMPSGRGRARSR